MLIISIHITSSRPGQQLPFSAIWWLTVPWRRSKWHRDATSATASCEGSGSPKNLQIQRALKAGCPGDTRSVALKKSPKISKKFQKISRKWLNKLNPFGLSKSFHGILAFSHLGTLPNANDLSEGHAPHLGHFPRVPMKNAALQGENGDVRLCNDVFIHIMSYIYIYTVYLSIANRWCWVIFYPFFPEKNGPKICGHFIAPWHPWHVEQRPGDGKERQRQHGQDAKIKALSDGSTEPGGNGDTDQSINHQ